MSILSGFSSDEITQLMDTPGAVITAVTVADGRPGILTMHRTSARIATVFRAARQDENELIRAVALAMQDRPEEPEEHESVTDLLYPDPEREAARAVEAVVTSIALLRNRAARADVDEYAAWLVGLASQIAEVTTKRGGLFGRRARTSPPEHAFIGRLRAAVSD
ncbi:hypothetical protein ACFV9G_19060 [Nocardioides sp. NPDC059952]|uniref:hypothetical protein n=1 Tax=Nocardioides sp. NPDC059952 TaxID=3347014 RepID=UPI003645F8E8